jgi:hypothetical protein
MVLKTLNSGRSINALKIAFTRPRNPNRSSRLQSKRASSIYDETIGTVDAESDFPHCITIGGSEAPLTGTTLSIAANGIPIVENRCTIWENF